MPDPRLEMLSPDETRAEIRARHHKDRNPTRVGLVFAFLHPEEAPIPAFPGDRNLFPKTIASLASAIGRSYTYGLGDIPTIMEMAREPFRRSVGHGAKLDQALEAFKRELQAAAEQARADFPDGPPDRVRVVKAPAPMAAAAPPTHQELAARAKQRQREEREADAARRREEKEAQRHNSAQRGPGRPTDDALVQRAKALAQAAKKANDRAERAESAARDERVRANAAIEEAILARADALEAVGGVVLGESDSPQVIEILNRPISRGASA